MYKSQTLDHSALVPSKIRDDESKSLKRSAKSHYKKLCLEDVDQIVTKNIKLFSLLIN